MRSAADHHAIDRTATRANASGVLTPTTGKLKGVLAILIYHRHHQVAVFRDRIEGANEAPHAVLLKRF